MLGRLCAAVKGCHFQPPGLDHNSTENTGRLSRTPSLLAAFLAPVSPGFQHIQLRQNAQGRGRAEGSILKQDKAVAPPRFTPARSAGRKYGGTKALGLLRSVF